MPRPTNTIPSVKARPKAKAEKPARDEKPAKVTALEGIDPDDVMMKPKATSLLTGYSVASLRIMRCTRQGPPYFKLRGSKQQSRVMYRRSDVLRWMQAQYVRHPGADE